MHLPMPRVTLNLGNVTNGDRVFVSAHNSGSIVVNGCGHGVDFSYGKQVIRNCNYNIDNASVSLQNGIVNSSAASQNNAGMPSVSGILQVTGSGSLIIQGVVTYGGAVSTGGNFIEMYAFFLKKQ